MHKSSEQFRFSRSCIELLTVPGQKFYAQYGQPSELVQSPSENDTVRGYPDAVKCSFIRSAFNVAELSMNQRIGYARVSTDDQNLDLQRDALRQAGCSTIYEEAAKERGTPGA